MTRQEFNTVDVLRLEVENDPPPGAVRNTVPNPDGKLGGWGWLSPIENTVVTGDPAHPNTLLMRTNTAQSGVYFTTEPIPVKAGATHTSMGFGRDSGVSTVGVSGRVDFLDAAGAPISSTAFTAILTGTNVTASLLSQAIPAGTAYLQIRLALTRGGAGALNAADSVNVESVELYQGTSGELAAPTVENAWTDILGPTHEITVERVELDLGVLTAAIRDATLDPSQADTIRTGKRIRLLVAASVPGIGGTGEPLFVGTIRNAQVSYDLTHPDATKRAQITLSAVDQAQPLANNTRTDGVAAVGELPAVFEGCGVPWNVNGNTGHTATTPVVVSRNENASAMDQVAITRDSNHAYAWFSREGVVNVWDAAALAALGPGPRTDALNEDVYNPGISVDYDTDRCINHVTLKYLRIDPVTGETEEVTYGPYTDDASRARWGTHAAEFTVHGITEDAATLTAYAATILTANATPAVRLNEATVPINALTDIPEWAVRDLYELTTVVNVNAGINEDARITRLSHRIEGGKWTVTYGFTTDGGVAQPQVTPSPTPSGGKTLSELLRPVGEMTMWYGNPNPVGVVTTNLATQPSFETSVSQWAIVSGSNAPAQSTTRAYGTHTKSMLVARGSGTSTLWASNDLSTKTGVSQTYTASARLWVPASNPSNCGLRVAGTSIVGTPIDVSTALRDQWVRVSVTFTRSASGTAFLYINGGASGQVWVDEVTIFQGSSAGPEFDGDTPDTETDLETIVYAWTGTPYASTSTKTVTPKVGQVPAGWLLCNGSSFSATDYPELAALLGATNTPNMVDVFPIGAGTKALGTNGGDPTKVILEANLPPHRHGLGGRAAATGAGASVPRGGTADGTDTNTTNGGATMLSTPLDVMNPWRAVHFIIRAR